jgi:hypothetical protein
LPRESRSGERSALPEERHHKRAGHPSGRPKEGTMSQQISPQHPAVVLRSHYVHLRTLLAIAMIAVVGLTVAVATLAINDGGTTSVSAGAPAAASTPRPLDVRSDGGPEEGTSGPNRHPLATNPYLYNGGHDEGSAGR